MSKHLLSLIVLLAIFQLIRPQAPYEFCDAVGIAQLRSPKGKVTEVDIISGCDIKHFSHTSVRRFTCDLNCIVKAFSGYDYRGRQVTDITRLGSNSVRFPVVARSILFSCN